MKHFDTLVISPHCDDEILGCGGAIWNRTKKLKSNVFVYYLGVEDHHIVSKEERLKEVEKVAKFMDFEYTVGNFVPNFQYALKLEIINRITELINKTKPNEIFIPCGKSYNQDHQTIYESCLVALRPHDINHFVKRVFVYEVDQYNVWPNPEFKPVYYEAIDGGAKIKAYQLHKSQVREMRPTQMLYHFAKIRGYSCKKEYAEGFEILRWI